MIIFSVEENTSKLEQLQLSLIWNRADIAEEKIFTGN